MEMWRFLILFLPIALSQNCEINKFILRDWDWVDVSVVFYTEFPCNVNSHPYHIFCEGNGWGNEEATVACREKPERYQYGVGGYISVQSNLSGYGSIECNGNETKLEECTVRKNIRQTCSSAAVVIKCFEYPPEVSVLDYPNEVREGDNMQVCLQTQGVVTESVHIHVETTHTFGYPPAAIAGYDYKITTSSLKFEPFIIINDEIRSQQQCLEIEIIDDSLPEDREVFTLLLSTNNSAVDQTIIRKFDTYINANKESTSPYACSEGNVTVVNDVNNSSLQLVEMCSSGGVWSSVCDDNWTLQDATVVCSQFGQDTVEYGVINNFVGSGSMTYECEGNETRLEDCMISTDSQETPCHYALVNCSPKTQVFVAHDPKYGDYLTVQEVDGYIQVCLQTNRVVTEPLHVHMETTHTNTTGNISHLPAIADYDYKATTHTLMFEIGSQQQCLEIEIINDSLPEDREVFTLLLSTDNSAVNLTTDRLDVYIQPNDGSLCPEGSVTVVSDVNNSSLQLVEMCA